MNYFSGSLALADPQSSQQVIERWLENAAYTKHCNKRHGARYPLFRPVTIGVGISQEIEISAFSRDISPTGIGLLHRANLPLQDVALKIETTRGRMVQCQATVVWSKPCGDGWYLSGMRAAGLSTVQVFTLLAEVLAGELKARWHRRYSFVYPATVKLGAQCLRPISVLTRDISPGGIGLIHDTNIHTRYANLRVEMNVGSGIDVPLDFAWSKPCGSGVFISGWRFWKPDIIELEQYSP